MNIFITGASGFLGKSLSKKLLNEGHLVSVLSRSISSVSDLQKMGAKVIKGDLQKFPPDCLNGIEAVFHFAAIRHEWGYSWKEYAETNINGTKNILDASLRSGVEKFIHCSSVFVFGNPKKIPADESCGYNPSSLYAKSKMEAEKIVKKYSSRINTVIIRPTIVYGPGDTTGMLLKLCRLIKKNMFVMVGNGKNLMHLTHIDDIVSGLILSLETPASDDFIICSEKPIELSFLSRNIAASLGKKMPFFWIPVFPARIAGFLFEIIYGLLGKNGLNLMLKEPLITRSKVDIISKSQYFSSKKAQDKIGFFPTKDIEKEIKNVISWYEKNGYL